VRPPTSPSADILGKSEETVGTNPVPQVRHPETAALQGKQHLATGERGF
jgi:hypothetical protein